MNIKGIVFPEINLNDHHDIYLVVEYFAHNRSEMSPYVDRWIRENMHGNKDLLLYYRHECVKKISNYKNKVEKLNYQIYSENRNDVLKKKNIIIAIYSKLTAYMGSTVEDDALNYKILRLPQPFATLVVSGIIQHLKIDLQNGLSARERVRVYAEPVDQKVLDKLYRDSYSYSNYINALNSGNIDNNIPVNAYIGVAAISRVDNDGTLYFENAKPLVNPSADFPTNLTHKYLCKPNNKHIKLEDRTIKVPLSDEEWGRMEKNEGETYFYWMPHFDAFYSERYGFGDKYGRYDILFYNGGKQKRFVQSLHSVTRDDYVLEVSNLEFKALVFHFDILKTGKKKESSFDVLQKKEWILDWRCVKFKSGYFVVLPPEDGSVKFKGRAFVYPQVVESYNYLREYLNERLEPIRCYVQNMQIEIYDQFKLNEAIERFATATKQRSIKTKATTTAKKYYAPQQLSFKQALSKAQQMTEEEFHKYKSKYIDYLVEQQGKDYKIIPCVEKLSYLNTDMTEYSFLFSVKCWSNDIMIVHENVNPDRSTLVFIVKKETYNEAIREIYDFLQSAEINKRSSLRNRSVSLNRKKIITYRSINHDDLNTWKLTLYRYKRAY